MNLNPIDPFTPRNQPLAGTVLIVDDEEPNRSLLADLLREAGCDIREAENGPQALDSIQVGSPDVILLDVMMPGMDGFEVCRRLKQDPSTAPIPVLMVTALTERQERLAGIRAGADDFLNKPVDLQEIKLRVGNALQTKRLYDQLKLEQQRSEQLLSNILPDSIAVRMKAGETTIADQHELVTIAVADLVGFTTLISQINPNQVVFLLDEIFSGFDDDVRRLQLEKIKTVGDAYMAAGGIHSTATDPAAAILQLAILMQRRVLALNAQYNTSLRIRIGISSGPLLSGVIGRERFAYDIWGNTVNIASHLQGMAFPGGILVDEATYALTQHLFRFSGALSMKLKNGVNVITRTLAPLPGTCPESEPVESCDAR